MESEIRHLRLMVAVAETGSVTRAAERLHLTPSALSHQLRDLESRLSVRLFHRVGKRMVPTPAGEQLLESAVRVLAIVTETENDIRRTAAGTEGRLRLSTQCYTCYHWLPPLVKRYRMRHPRVDVRIDASATSDPADALLAGRLDVAVMSTPPNDRRLIARPLFDDDLLVVMAPGHRLASQPFVAPEDFAAETVLLYPPIEENSVFQNLLAPAGVTPASVQLVALTEAIIELVKAGLGIAVLARWAVAPHVKAGTLAAVKLTRTGYRRTWSAVTLADNVGVAYIDDFISLLSARAGGARNQLATRPVDRRARR